MNKFLNKIRSIENEIPITRKIINTILILCFGIVLGTFAKFLDTTASNTLPFIFEYLDISNFLGRFAIWLLIALYIAIYSHSSIRASLNVLAFVCWYAKGKSKISFILSVIIIAILFKFTFIYGWIYFDVYSILEVIVFGCALIALKRNTFRETTYMILSAVVIAVILNMLVPFHFG